MKLQKSHLVRNLARGFAGLLAALIVAETTPLAALALPELPFHAEVPIAAQVIAEPKTGPKQVTIVKPSLNFSATPTDLEITSARVFHEPLIPMSGKESGAENADLVKAIKAFKAKNDLEDLSAFTSYIESNPDSRWVPSLAASVGEIKFKTGYLSDAITLWTLAWEKGKAETDRDKAAVASHAIAHLLILDARLGRMDELKKYHQKIRGRAFFGSDEERVRSSREGLWNMENNIGCSFKCGPFAVNSLRNAVNKTHEMSPIIEKAQSTQQGTTLAQVKRWADAVGLNYQLAKRSKGAPFLTPSLIHWKLNHFATIVAEENGRFKLQDPTFDTDGQLWVTAKALEQETDGYFLVSKDKPLPAGWEPVTEEEAKTVHGKGNANGRRGGDCYHPAPNTPPCQCDPCHGMARADIWSMLATLHIADTPLSYSPPIGPAIDFSFDYNHLQPDQPTTFTFTNLGQNWNFNWLSYLTVDAGSGAATVRLRSGGTENFTLSGGVYSPAFLTQALLVNMGGGVYQRRMKDGSVEVYNQADSSSPPRIFLTQYQDPQGNSVSVQYDSNFRITSVTDAIGQVSTLSYVSNTVGNSGFYKIASIADPFGRTCGMVYDPTNSVLLSITDAVNLKSSFQYDTTSSFISQMSTPYGTTQFYQYIPGIDVYPARGIRFTFPDGTSSVLENWLNEPKATYFWDRHALAMYPNDPANKVYTHCRSAKYTIDINTNLEASTQQWIANPLETGLTYITYPTNLGPNYAGFNNLPTTITKSLGNPVVNCTVGGTVTTGDILGITTDFTTAYYTVLAGDTAEKIAIGLANSVNANSGLQTRGVAAGVAGKVVSLHSDQNVASRYTAFISGGATETLTFNSQARQTAIASLSGAITAGDVTSIFVDTNSGRVTCNYTVQPGDTASTIATGMAAVMNASPGYQSYQGVAVANGAQISLSCFAPEIVTYNSGTTGTETYVYSSYRSGATRLTENQYNSTGNLTQTIDPVGRKFSFSYDTNGIDLLETRETQGTDNYLLGHWEYNTKHEPIVYIDGSAQRTEYTYNSSGQPLTVKDPNNNITKMTYTGTCKATVSGTITAGNVATITVFDAGLAGGQKAVNYTVLGTDTTTTVATALRNNINADTALQAIGVSATSAAAVVTMSSTSVSVTTYTKTTTGTIALTLGANTYGYLTKIDGPLTGTQDVTTFTYDTVGRLASVTNSTGYTLSYLYDNLDRLLRVTYPDTSFEQIVYERMDPILTRDRNARWTQSAYDVMDQKRYEIDPLGRKTQYTWCTCGSLSALTDALGRTTSWSHDIQGRLTTKTYPDSSTYNYSYEAYTSNVQTRTDALAQKTNYFYNPDGKLFQKNYRNPINPTAPVSYYWDYNFNRLAKVTKNDWGSYNYTYNNYVTSSGATPITGGGMLQLVHNDVITNSDITYLYDALGRTSNRSINGAANSVTWTYDAMSRVTSESNALGNFTYTYVDDTAGSSKGVTRLASVGYPNGQVTKYDWYPTAQDERLKQIANLGPSANTISQFSYRYDPAGQIKQWQQLQGNTSLNYALDYDQAGQLTSAAASGGAQSPSYLRQYYYAYDNAANRTGAQSNTVTRARLAGTITAGNILTLTVTDSALPGGSKAINYTVVGGDTLSTIATKMAAAVTADTDMQNAGICASANAAIVSVKSSSPNVTSYGSSTSGGATTTITLGVTDNFVENAVVAGTKKTGDILTITFKDPALSGGTKNVNYTVLAADTLTTITTALKNAINADTALQAIGVSATSVGTSITIKSTSLNATTYAQSLSNGSTETISLSINQNGPVRIGIGGSKTTGDTVSLVSYDTALSGGTKTTSYTVLAGDTLQTITSGLAAAINADTSLQGIGVSASSTGTVLTVNSNSTNATTYRSATSVTATETVSIGLPANGVQTAVIGGTKTTGDTLTITVFDAGLSGGSKAVNYVVLAGDTLTSIATNIAAAINADTALQTVSVSATSSSTVLNIASASGSATTYAKSISGGATETITLASSTSTNLYGYNNLNEVTSIAAGGPTKFQGTSNKALKSATVNGNAASLQFTQSFAGNASLASGANNIPVAITDGTNTTNTKNYQVSTKGSASATPTFDANGNMTSDGTNSYVWNAENQLINIVYPGTNNYSQFFFDPAGRNSKIVEVAGGSITSTIQQIWCGSCRCEQRDGTGTLTILFATYGQKITGANYFCMIDHLGSMREFTDNSGNIQARFAYTPFGQPEKFQGSIDTSFGFAGYYKHSASQLSLTLTRAYSSSLGRWLNRDSIEEQAGSNMFAYVENSPISLIDSLGLLSDLSSGGTRIDVGRPVLEGLISSEGLSSGDSAQLDRGCIGLCSLYQGLGELFPENANGTKCYLTLEKALKRKCKKCEHPFIFAKQGQWQGPAPAPGLFGGSVPNNSISSSGGNYNYVTMFSSTGSFAWMNHMAIPGGDPQIGTISPTPVSGDPHYPHEIWCVTCIKNK